MVKKPRMGNQKHMALLGYLEGGERKLMLFLFHFDKYFPYPLTQI